MEDDWKEYLSKRRSEYAQIGYVECPVFPNEKIYFTQSGFRHLIGKQRKMRDRNEQIKRITFLQYAPGVLKRSTKFSTNFTNIAENGIKVSFWSFEGKVNGISLVVIVRQIDSQPKHFFSIFDK